MSKSLGNSPDPLQLITTYGADGVRVGMLLCSPAGNDLLFDENLTEQGRNFCNKLWNTFRLIKGWETDEKAIQSEAALAAIQWFDSKLNQSIALIEDHFSKFRISHALMVIYTLVRDEFSGWYLEAVKPAYQQPIDEKTYHQTIEFLKKMLKVLHPFMPFITEEIYQRLRKSNEKESIMISDMPVKAAYDTGLLEGFEETKEIITTIRNIRQEKNLSNIDKLHLKITGRAEKFNQTFLPVIYKLAFIGDIAFVEKAQDGAATFLVKTTEYNVPLGDLLDVETEKKKLREELKYQKGFLHSVMKKLGNEKFVNNAPKQVVEIEMKKKADAEAKIKSLEKQIENLI